MRLARIVSIVASFIPALASAQALPAADGPGGIAGVKTWAADRTHAAQQAFNGERMPSPGDWGDQVVYQIQVDRFNDGDPGNNGANVSTFQRDHRFTDQRGLADYHHGGDLQGIINRLDYLRDLGVTTLWITPVLKNAPAYHGYCTTDFTQVDPNFGNAALLRTLTREAHRRGLRIVLDIVVNHMCSNDSRYSPSTPFSDANYNNCVNDLNFKRFTGSANVRGQRLLELGASFFPPFRSQHFFSRCGFRPGDFASQGNGALFGDFTGEMLDFDTMNHDFQSIFTELHKFWIAEVDVDGFRLDAAKHVTEDFLAKFSTDVRGFASSLGKSNFYVIAEVAASPEDQARRLGKMRANIFNPDDRSANIAETLRNRLRDLKDTYLAHGAWPMPGPNGIYDFSHSGAIVDVFHQAPGRKPLDLKQWFWAGGELEHQACSAGFCELAFNGSPHLNWNQIEIHDWPRFGQIEFGGDRGRIAGQLRAALGYLMTAPGVPILYYGVEQGFDGNCPADSGIGGISSQAFDEVKHVCSAQEHTRYRQDMFVMGPWRLRSLEPAVDPLAHIGFDQHNAPPADWTQDPYLNRSHDLYRYVRKLVAIRGSCAPLRRGETYFRAAHGSTGGLLAFSRIHAGQEMVVIVNTGDNPASVSQLIVDANIHRNRDFAVYRNLLNGFQTATIGDFGQGKGLYFQGGFSLDPHAVAIFAADSRIAPYDPELGAHRCTAADKADAAADDDQEAEEAGCRVGGGDGHVLGLVGLVVVGMVRRRRRPRR